MKKQAGSQVFFSSLRTRLIALILLALLPVYGLLIKTNIEQRAHLNTDTTEYVSNLANSLRYQHNLLLDSTHSLLLALSQSQTIHDETRREFCSDIFAMQLEQYPYHSYFGVSSPTGDVFCSAVPLTEPLNLADSNFFQRTLDSKSCAVSTYSIDLVTQQPVIYLSSPVLDDNGEIIAVVFATIKLSYLNTHMAELERPPNTAFAILDHTGTIISHYPNPEEWVGQSLQETDFYQSMQTEQEGVLETSDWRGKPAVIGYTSLSENDEAISFQVVSVDTNIAMEPIHQLFKESLLWLGWSLFLFSV